MTHELVKTNYRYNKEEIFMKKNFKKTIFSKLACLMAVILTVISASTNFVYAEGMNKEQDVEVTTENISTEETYEDSREDRILEGNNAKENGEEENNLGEIIQQIPATENEESLMHAEGVEVTDGNYTILGEIRKEDLSEVSMGDSALERLTIIVTGGEMKLFLDMGGMAPLYLSTMTYYDVDTATDKGLVVTKSEGGNNLQFSMPIGREVNNIKLTFAATGMPMAQSAALVLDWSSFNLTSGKPITPTPMQSPAATVTPTQTPSSTVVPTSTQTPAPTQTQAAPATALDKTNLANGIYEVQVDMWHATNNQESMASSGLVKKARIEVTNGQYKMYLYTKPMELGGITASLQLLQVENGQGGYAQAVVATKDQQGNPASFSFNLPHKEEYLDIRVDPKVAIMGNTYIDARLKINWNTLATVKDGVDLKAAPVDSNGGNRNSGTGSPNNSGTSKVGNVKTGDNSMVKMLIALMGISVAIILHVKKKGYLERT